MWISVHTGIDGPKLRDFRKKLKCSKFEATGILIYFWFWGLENAEKDGHILHADREDIEECLRGSGVGCKIPPDLIVDSLIETGWIDETDNGFYIHDWEVWQEQWYKAKERRESDAKRKRESRRRDASPPEKESADIPADSPQDSRSDGKRDSPEDKETASEGEHKPLKKDEPETYSEGFVEFWNAYPRKVGKAEAYKKYKTRIKDGWSEAELLTAAKNYAVSCKRQKTEAQYIKHPKTFLSDNTPFTDFLPKKEEVTPKVAPNGNPFGEYGGDN